MISIIWMKKKKKRRTFLPTFSLSLFFCFFPFFLFVEMKLLIILESFIQSSSFIERECLFKPFDSISDSYLEDRSEKKMLKNRYS